MDINDGSVNTGAIVIYLELSQYVVTLGHLATLQSSHPSAQQYSNHEFTRSSAVRVLVRFYSRAGLRSLTWCDSRSVPELYTCLRIGFTERH